MEKKFRNTTNDGNANFVVTTNDGFTLKVGGNVCVYDHEGNMVVKLVAQEGEEVKLPPGKYVVVIYRGREIQSCAISI